MGFAAQQIGVVLSIGGALVDPSQWGKIPDALEKAYYDYFFEDQGYTILGDGGSIKAPSFSLPQSTSNLNDIIQAVRSYATLKTAEQYTRDLVRITGGETGNVLYQLKDTYPKLPSGIPHKIFKGLASLAESTTTSAVEQLAQGLGNFSTSPLIAASLGTFAGTAARKATQDAVIKEFVTGIYAYDRLEGLAEKTRLISSMMHDVTEQLRANGG